MQLEFFGAAGEVTGSCHILTVGGRRLLLDCGMIQGGATADERNRASFPFDAAQVDAVILSHAHIDHCGRLPLLRNRGFRGPVYANPACRDLVRILLADGATMAERDAERENRRRKKAGDPRQVEPLYTLEDAQAAIARLAAVPIDPGFVLNEITLLRLRALMAQARGDEAGYRDYRDRYRAMATSLGFEGHMEWAEAMT